MFHREVFYFPQCFLYYTLMHFEIFVPSQLEYALGVNGMYYMPSWYYNTVFDGILPAAERCRLYFEVSRRILPESVPHYSG